MVQSHLSTLAAPKNWGMKRKGVKWIARPLPGPHALQKCVTASMIVKDMLRYAKTTREVNWILNNSHLVIDGVIRKERRFPVGFMDVVEIAGSSGLEERYRIVYNKKGRFVLLSIEKKDAELKLLKIIVKKIVKGGKIQIGFHDGRSMRFDKFENKVGDSVVFDLNKRKIVEVISLKKGATIFLCGGKCVGCLAKVEDIILGDGRREKSLVININGKKGTTLTRDAFVVGLDKPVIKVMESIGAGSEG